MKKQISKISVLGGVLAGDAKKNAPAQTRAEALSPSRVPISKTKRGLRVRVLASYRFRVPAKKQLVLLTMPAVSRWITWQRRLMIAQAAQRLIGRNTISMRQAAFALDVAPSMLCGWLKTMSAEGAQGLYPRTHRASNAPCGEPCRIDLLLA